MLRKATVRTTVSATILMLVAAAAYAGPPLICHQFDAGNARLLPWAADGQNWNSPDPSYDVTRLTADTLRLLTPETPVIARMEIMRRATIYAAGDPQVAADLLRAVTARMQADAGKGRDALAWFDAGYLIESYRQAAPALKRDLLARGGRSTSDLDGYGMVRKALRLGGTAEMEYAASLMKTGPEATAHRQRAAAAAEPGSLLARNLATY